MTRHRLPTENPDEPLVGFRVMFRKQSGAVAAMRLKDSVVLSVGVSDELVEFGPVVFPDPF